MKRFAPLLLAVVAVFAACGDDDEPATAVPTDPHNEADVTFAQGMIPHHAQAVEMARLAPERSGSDEVEELAEQIEDAQDPEIETMSAWLEAWDEEVPSTDTEAMAGMDMGGMMSADEMADLSDAEGEAFDRLFLALMTEHHTGAVEMAGTEIADGTFPDAIELAEAIERTQTEEIGRMEELRSAL